MKINQIFQIIKHKFFMIQLIISIAGSENDETFEYAPLEFDPAYLPLEKWTRNHPKEQVLGNPQDGVTTRA